MKPCEVTCPKCGCEDVHQKYHAKGEQIRVACLNYVTADRELLYTTCRNCQYAWEVECLVEEKK